MLNNTEPCYANVIHVSFTILSRDATSNLKFSRHIISRSDTLTYPGSVWRSSEEASEALSTSRPPLLWAAGLLGLGGMEVNETRPNLASTAPRAARNQSETPSLFRALWTLQSASGTAAYRATPRSWRETQRGRGDSQNVSHESTIFNYYLGLKIWTFHGGNYVNILTKLLFPEITLTVSLLTCQFGHFYNHLIFTPLSVDTWTAWSCKWLRHVAHCHNSLP